MGDVGGRCRVAADLIVGADETNEVLHGGL